jgi:hypothetical protein
LARVQAEVETMISEEKGFIHPYSLSLDTISNCLSILASQKVLTRSRNKNSIFYEIDAAQVLSVKSRLEQYGGPRQVLEGRVDSIQLHLKNKL